MEEPKMGGDPTSTPGQVPEDSLTDKEKLFIDEYLICWNASEAARRAGYKDPGQAGYENKKKQEIQDVIKARLAEKAMEADEVLARLADIARVDMSDFISPSGRGYRIDLKKAASAGKLHLLKKFSKGRKGVEIELPDFLAALEKIGRHHGLFKDVHEVNGAVEVNNIGLSDEERAARIVSILDAARERRTGQPAPVSEPGSNRVDQG